MVQDPETLIFNAQVWAPDQSHRWRHADFTRPDRPPLIYEAHVGMAQEEEKLAPPPPPKEQADIDKPLPPQKEEKLAKAPQDQEVPIFTVVEEMPEYPGGMKAMYAYLGENIKYPQEAKNKGISGTVFITYVVEKDGSVSNVKVLRGVKEDLDKEAIRVVSMMPKWKPGKQKGIPVRVQYNLPIKFSLEETQTKEK